MDVFLIICKNFLFEHYLRKKFLMLWIAVHNVMFVMFLKPSVKM
jgi:hypothetical protein